MLNEDSLAAPSGRRGRGGEPPLTSVPLCGQLPPRTHTHTHTSSSTLQLELFNPESRGLRLASELLTRNMKPKKNPNMLNLPKWDPVEYALVVSLPISPLCNSHDPSEHMSQSERTKAQHTLTSRLE